MPPPLAIEKLYPRIQYTFQKEELAVAALTHSSASSKNNERMEFLGDALLGSIVGCAVYQQYPDANEGELTRARASLVKEDSLYRIANDLGLGDFLYLGCGELKSGGPYRPSILADALEALIAAIYLDSHYELCESVVLKWYEPWLTQLKLSDLNKKDPKSLLQEYTQANKLSLPVYCVEEVMGKPHERIYTVSCLVGDTKLTAQASSRRRAEQSVASLLIQKLDHEK